MCGGLGRSALGALATKKAVYGFVTVRYQWELAARTATEGAAWNIMATFPIKPIRLSSRERFPFVRGARLQPDREQVRLKADTTYE